MKRILVPTDFSLTAEKAFRFALALASKAQGSIILYHICTPVRGNLINSEEQKQKVKTKAQLDLMKRLQRLKKKVTASSPGVPVSTIIGRSPIIDNILGFAEHNQIDLVIMGTHGATGIKKNIIGSISARVVKQTDIPVLLVPTKAKLKDLKQFVYASDYLETDKKALSLILPLAKLCGAKTNVIHIYEEDGLNEENEKTDFETYSHVIQKEFIDAELKFHLLKSNSVTQTMKNLFDEIPYDLLVMVRRHRNFMEKVLIKSFTKNMAYISKHPLLIIPQVENEDEQEGGAVSTLGYLPIQLDRLQVRKLVHRGIYSKINS